MNIIYSLYNYFLSNNNKIGNKYESYIKSIVELNKNINWFGVADYKL